MAYIKKNWLLLTIILVVLAVIPFAFAKNNHAYTPAQVANVSNRTLNSSFQVSDQRMAIVTYNVAITNTATLVLGNSGQVILEISPDNSTWTQVNIGPSSVGSGLVITSISSVSVTGYVPRGYYVRIRTNNVTGTPTYAYQAGVEILIN